MKKILIVQDSLNGGGAEKVLIDILNNVDYTKYTVNLLLLFNQGVYLNSINKNVKVRTIMPNEKYNNIIYKKIYWLFANTIYKFFCALLYKKYVKEKYDIEIAFMEGPSTVFVSKSKNKLSRKIAWIHADLSKHRTMKFTKEKSVLSTFDSIVCVSDMVKEVLDKLYPNLHNKTQVLYNIIDSDNIRKMAEEYIPDKFKKNTIVTLGRLERVKRIDLIIKAHKILLDNNIENNLKIIGIGSELNNLIKLTKELGVKDSVTFEGFKENPYPYIKKCDIFTLTSDNEGMSLVIAEALVLGKAILSTKSGGPENLLANGKYGICVECGNEKEIAINLKRLIEDSSLLNRYQEKSLERSEIFNIKSFMKNFYLILEGEK